MASANSSSSPAVASAAHRQNRPSTRHTPSPISAAVECPYSRDYYRVHFEGLGQTWVFRDARDRRFYLQGLFD